ncbi:hypothetical protein F5884DRAFT_85621 [Xylogone sp. PMI_703]|nr:hypothetical protein F5884DRAFT_85621 [Xylogone sp. PMI_703]
MAEPPYKRSRRPDSKQMWEESDRRSAPRDREEPRDRRDDRHGDRDRDRERDRYRDRNRRYRSRSPRDQDRARGGRRDDGRDARGYRRDERDRGDDRPRRDDDRYGSHGGRSRDEPKESRNKPRERSKSPRRSASRSPRRERDYDSRMERDSDKGKDRFLGGREEFSKSRTATPPAHLSFKVHSGSGSARDSPAAQDHDRMAIDSDNRNGRANSAVRDTVEEQNIEEDEEIVVLDDGMEDMKAMMGFGGFGTTHQKKVPGNNVSAVRKEKKTEYRQYMNRVGGFNRPLSPTR